VPYHHKIKKKMWVFGRKFCENLADNFVPFHHKNLRELGRKIFDFVVIWYFAEKLCDFRTATDQKKICQTNVFFSLSDYRSLLICSSVIPCFRARWKSLQSYKACCMILARVLTCAIVHVHHINFDGKHVISQLMQSSA
jgi:hypothetical protein